MRIALLLVLLGCSDSVHELGDCGEWPIFAGSARSYECERACTEQPADFDDTGPSVCIGSNPNETQTLNCSSTFTFEGARGCCRVIQTLKHPAWIEFFVCQ